MNIINRILVFRSVPEKIWSIPPKRAVKKLLGSGTARSYVCRIGLCPNIVPLSRRCPLSYFLNAICNKYMKSSGVIIDVAQHRLTVSPEDFVHRGIL